MRKSVPSISWLFLALLPASAGGQTVATAHNVPGGPHIASVSPVYPLRMQKIVIQGTGFGTADPFNGTSGYVMFVDLAHGNNFTNYWQAGCPVYTCGTGGLTIYVTRWTATEIDVEGFPQNYGTGTFGMCDCVFHEGDNIQVLVANPQMAGEIKQPSPAPFSFPAASQGAPYDTFSMTVSAWANPITIDSVSPIGSVQKQKIIVQGAGFGNHEPFNGTSPFFGIKDITADNWLAGFDGAMPVIVSKWTPGEIVVEGFGQGYGGTRALHDGDMIAISIANPQMTGVVNSPQSGFQGSPSATKFVTVETGRDNVSAQSAGSTPSTDRGLTLRITITPARMQGGGFLTVGFNECETQSLIGSVRRALQTVSTAATHVGALPVPTSTDVLNEAELRQVGDFIDTLYTIPDALNTIVELGSGGVELLTLAEAEKYVSGGTINLPTSVLAKLPAGVAGIGNEIFQGAAQAQAPYLKSFFNISSTCQDYEPNYILSGGQGLQIVATNLRTLPTGTLALKGVSYHDFPGGPLVQPGSIVCSVSHIDGSEVTANSSGPNLKITISVSSGPCGQATPITSQLQTAPSAKVVPGQPAIVRAVIRNGQTSLQLPRGQMYLYGMVTGGAAPTKPFASGEQVHVEDSAGLLSAGVAYGPDPQNSYDTQTGFHAIGGVSISGSWGSFKTFYGENHESGASSASAQFSLKEGSLVVVIGVGSSQQSIRLQGVPGLQTDALNSGGGTEAMVIAHTFLAPGTYTVSEATRATAAGQDPEHMADLIGVFVFESKH